MSKLVSCVAGAMAFVLVMVAEASRIAATEPIRSPGPECGQPLESKTLGVGPVMDVAATSLHLYAIGGGKLFVLDLSRPDQPPIVGQLAGLGHVRQIAVQDDIAYITSREDGLFIVDVRRPDQASLLSHYDTIELATGIAVSGEVAAVANRYAGVELLDIRDPKRPIHLSTVRVGEAQSVVFQGGCLYAGVWATNELAIVDVRNPRRPRLIATAPLDGHGDGLAVRGNLAFAATGHHSRARPAAKPGEPGFGRGHGLEVLDVSDPARPRLLSRLKFPPFYRLGMDMWGVELAGDSAFVNDTYGGLFIVDIRDPARPRCIAHGQLPVVTGREDPSPVAGAAIAAGRVYLAGAWSDLHVVTPPVPVVAEAAAGPGLKVPPDQPLTAGPADVYKTDGQVHAVLPWRADGQGTLLLVAAGTGRLHVVRRTKQFEPVATYPEMEKLLLESGIRHVRTDPVTAPQAVANVKRLAAARVKFDFIIHPDGDRQTVAQLLENVKKNFSDCTELIEGLNEPDGRPEQAREWMAEIRRICQADPMLKGIPILGSALAHPYIAAMKIGDCSGLVDVGNIHAYPGGRAPEITLPLYVGYVQPQYPKMKYAITETGYHSALNNPPNKHKPASRRAEAIYMPRLHLEYFRCGIVRSYKYQFVDDRTEDEAKQRGQPVQEAHFGYVDYDLQPKPSYHAVKNLLTILRDQNREDFQPQSLRYSVEGPKKELRHLLLQKSDGDFYLALWRAVAVWDENARQDLPVPSVPAEVRLPAAAKTIRVYQPTQSAEPVKTKENVDRVLLELEAEAVILQISPKDGRMEP